MRRRHTNLPQLESVEAASNGDPLRGLRNLEKFVKFRQTAAFEGQCGCGICLSRKPPTPAEQLHYLNRPRLSRCPYRDLIECLAARGRRTLRVCVPDVCFFDGNQPTAFYCTNPRDLTLRAPYAILTEKQLEGVFRHHRAQYLDSMKLLFEKGIQNNLTFKEVHENFSGTILPTHFYEGLVSGVERRTILREKRLVVHRDARLQLQAVQSNAHEEQAAYVVQFSDGNHQLLGAGEFWNLIPNRRAHGHMAYIKSYIKPRGDGSRFFTHEYRAEVPPQQPLFSHAAVLAGILAEEISVYDERYLTQEFFEEEAEKVRDAPEAYLQLQAYRIVNFVERVHLRRSRYLRTRWVLNDLGNYYLDEVLEWDWEQLPAPRPDALAPEQHNQLLSSIAHDEDFFIATFEDIARQKDARGLHSLSTLDDAAEPSRAQVRARKPARPRLARTLEPQPRRDRHSVTTVRRKVKPSRYQLEPMRLSAADGTPEGSRLLDRVFIL